jgi:hypothetical protein
MFCEYGDAEAFRREYEALRVQLSDADELGQSSPSDGG